MRGIPMRIRVKRMRGFAAELENVRLLAETVRSDAAREALSAAERALMQLKDVRRSSREAAK